MNIPMFGIRLLATILCLCGLIGGQPLQAQDYAVRNVNVIPMDRERVLPDQTVLIKAGRIVKIGDAGHMSIPARTKIIDGTGRYLIPGLSDMHVHIYDADIAPPEAADWRRQLAETVPHQLFLYLANGVTTVRNMLGNEFHLKLKTDIAAGKIEGPRIFTAAGAMDGDPPLVSLTIPFKDTKSASDYVRQTARKGFDFVKVSSTLPPAIYDAIFDTAKEVGLPVAGHLPMPVDLDHALAMGQRSIEHLTGYDVALAAGRTLTPGMSNIYMGWAYGTQAKIEEMARKTAQANVWNCPTLYTFDHVLSDFDRTRLQRQPHIQFMPPILRDDSVIYDMFDARNRASLVGTRSVRLAMVKALSDAGARLLAGSDAAGAVTIPGFSLHQELEVLVEAGLTPYQALVAATAEPARYFEREDEFGTIAVGRSADLVLLDANPLANISNTQRISGVMVRGRWYPKAALDQRLEAMARSFEASSAAAATVHQ